MTESLGKHRVVLEACVLASAAPADAPVLAALEQVQAGRREDALAGYRQAATAPLAGPAQACNLAALALGLDLPQEAEAHARRALALAPGLAQAWVNLGVAQWRSGRRRDGAQAMARACALAPALEAAALDLATMWRSVGQPTSACAVLQRASAALPRAPRIQQMLAECARLAGDVGLARSAALAALELVRPALRPEPAGQAGSMVAAHADREDEAADTARMRTAMAAACDALQAAGIGHHLVGGVVLGIVRQGRPFAGDKDVDIGVEFDADREAVAAAMAAGGFRAIEVPAAAADPRWCMGYVHPPTGIGIDLFFKQPVDGKLRICLGWPDGLIFDLPHYQVGALHWEGRTWPVPVPVEDYLVAEYGDGWRSPTREVDGHRYDKRWHDTQLSSPSLHPDSVPSAVNLGLLRVLAALQERRWPKALALCDQLQARYPLPPVAALRAQLLAAGVE